MLVIYDCPTLKFFLFSLFPHLTFEGISADKPSLKSPRYSHSSPFGSVKKKKIFPKGPMLQNSTVIIIKLSFNYVPPYPLTVSLIKKRFFLSHTCSKHFIASPHLFLSDLNPPIRSLRCFTFIHLIMPFTILSTMRSRYVSQIRETHPPDICNIDFVLLLRSRL